MASFTRLRHFLFLNLLQLLCKLAFKYRFIIRYIVYFIVIVSLLKCEINIAESDLIIICFLRKNYL